MNRRTLTALALALLAGAACTVIYRSSDVTVDRSEHIDGSNRVTKIEITPAP
jgi:hypothetical protein